MAPSSEEIKPPRCPHCRGDLAAVELFNWVFPPWIILECHCPHPECKKSLAFQIVPINVSQGQKQPSGTRLVD